MVMSHNEALERAREEVLALHADERAEQDDIIAKRKEAEENAWNEIDGMTDKNKDILAENIEKGMENKAELTKYMRELMSQNMERSNKAKDLQEKKNQLENKINEIKKIEADIKACYEQLE